MKNPIIEELKVLKDEIKLQAQLFSMDAKDELVIIEKKLDDFAKEIEKSAEKIGQVSEEIWIGKHMELKNLKEEYEKLRSSQVQGH